MWKSGPPDDDVLDQKLPSGWEVESKGVLGKGGMSRVFRVRDAALGRETALKLLRPELVKEPEAFERFVLEARITAQLDHPNIPSVYAFAAEKKKLACFTMKVLEGVSLQQLIDQGKSVGVGLLPALEVLIRVCDAMAFAHAKGIIHCDLKPANVMVAEHGQIYVVDWGLARQKKDLPSKEQDDQSAIGTPAYMAPEQARGQNHALDERTDIFALGGMLYRVIAGRPPYVGSTAEETLALAKKALVAPPAQVAHPGAAVPARLATVAMKALHPDPLQRYQSVVELRGELEDFVHGTANLPEQTFIADQVIVQEGEKGDCAYLIRSGKVEATRGEGDKLEHLAEMGPGEMFGEAAVLTQGSRLATVTALETTVVAVVDRAFLEEEMQRSTLVALAIRAVANTVLGMNAQAVALLEERAALRAAAEALVELAQQPGARELEWKALEERLCGKHGTTPKALEKALAAHPQLKLDRERDRLVLSTR